MKNIFVLIVLALTITSCSKQKDELVAPVVVQKPVGTFIFYNETSDTYRVELWRYNSGGLPPAFYTVLPGQSMVITNSVAGKWIVGFLQMSGFSSEDTRVDYWLTTELQENCFFDWHIK